MLSFCFYLVIEQLSRLILVFNNYYPGYLELFNLDILIYSIIDTAHRVERSININKIIAESSLSRLFGFDKPKTSKNLSVSFFNISILNKFNPIPSWLLLSFITNRKGLIYPLVLRIRMHILKYNTPQIHTTYKTSKVARLKINTHLKSGFAFSLAGIWHGMATAFGKPSLIKKILLQNTVTTSRLLPFAYYIQPHLYLQDNCNKDLWNEQK